MASPLVNAPEAGSEPTPELVPAPERAGLAGTPPGNLPSALSDASVITIAAYAAQALIFLAGLIQKGLLGAVGTGYWALMQSFWQFSKVASGGAFDGTTRQIPLHRGRKDYVTAAAVANTGFSFSLVAMTVLGVFMVLVPVTFGGGWAPELRWGIVLLGVTGPLRWLLDAHETLLQATRQFRSVSKAAVLEAFVGLTAQSLLVVLFGFYGMFAGVVATTIVALAYYAQQGLTGLQRPAFRFEIDFSKLRELIAYGLPIMVFGQLWLLFLGIDNLIVAGYISVEQLGYYALAVSVTSYVMFLPRSIGQALFPRMVESFGATDDVKSLTRYVSDTQRLLGFMLVPILVAAAFYAVPVLIRHALPEFKPAIEVVHIMAAGSYVMALCSLPNKAMLTAGRRGALIVLVLVCLGVNAGLNLFAVAVLDEGIRGAALATVASYVFAFVITSGYGLSMMIGARATAQHVGELLVVFAYSCAALWGIEELVGSGAGALIPDALTAALKLALFIVAMAPWLWATERKLGAVSRVIAAGRSALAALARRRAR